MISQLRRKVGDIPQSSQSTKAADGSSTLFNLPRAPIVEGSYSIYFGTSAKTETLDYTLDKDSGDLLTQAIVSNGVLVKGNYKFANFRDQNWVEAINYGVDYLNARGFFRQIVRSPSGLTLSAGIQTYAGPTRCIDLYEFLISDNQTTSGNFGDWAGNWTYQQDANKVVLGSKPVRTERTQVSYLRNLATYQATSATVDSLDDWIEIIKKKAEEYYWDRMAGKIATTGAATIDEGHFSFSNLRAMARDAERAANDLSIRKKPTRPAKEIGWNLPGRKV